MNDIKKLLEKWAALEPDKCKIRLLDNNKIISFVVQFDDTWELILANNLELSKSLMIVQHAVQQAIIEKGWYFEIRYQPTSGGYQAEVGNLTEHSKNNMTEALLTAYLKVLEAHA